MLVHLNLIPVLKHIGEMQDDGLRSFVISVLLSQYYSSFRVPRLYGSCPPLPSLLTHFSPHPLTTFPLFYPKLRGFITTTFLSKLMPYHLPLFHQILHTLNPFTPTPKILSLQNHVMSEGIVLDDGSYVSLVWPPCSPPFMVGDTLVLILPGMNNSSETGFVRCLQQTLTLKLNNNKSNNGHVHCCILDYRLTGTSQHLQKPNENPHPSCADGWLDLPTVISHINHHYTSPPIHLVGQSLGGGMTLKYLGGIDTPQNIVSGTCVSPPVDYSKVAKHLEDGIVSRVCNFVMTVPCKIALVLNGTMRRAIYNKSKLFSALTCLTVRGFEDAVLVPLLDYTSPEDYYNKNSPKSTILNIRVPTLIITAEDDPIVPPPDEIKNENIGVAVVDFGGHLGFFDFMGWSWSDEVVAEHVGRRIGEWEKREGGEEVRRKRTSSIQSNESDVSEASSTGLVKVKRRPSVRGTILGF
ncbi:hypothetical protein TL16_g08091 [Triparma laevis f. inornata]|uniref:AB hydrolase-1 domain-containing protein n=2 Tax=Triparma laevis TaxID=1534972 RepID=A0A9W6ZDN9_9STRA|nr:hypothetical protein TrLO_g13909 [Triparma laevis f. longispina]GMH79285.1 hypothetical protein TL16_g08091 [Triparma laevis f. inornata]